MSNASVCQQLKNVLAESYALLLKTQNYHWNVTGSNFSSLHALFEAQYKDLAEAIDVLAERIRALGEKVPASFSVFAKSQTLTEGNENAKSHVMVRELADDQRKTVNLLKKALEVAQLSHDDATADMLIERIEAHEKNAWMLDATADIS